MTGRRGASAFNAKLDGVAIVLASEFAIPGRPGRGPSRERPRVQSAAAYQGEGGPGRAARRQAVCSANLEDTMKTKPKREPQRRGREWGFISFPLLAAILIAILGIAVALYNRHRARMLDATMEQQRTQIAQQDKAIVQLRGRLTVLEREQEVNFLKEATDVEFRLAIPDADRHALRLLAGGSGPAKLKAPSPALDGLTDIVSRALRSDTPLPKETSPELRALLASRGFQGFKSVVQKNRIPPVVAEDAVKANVRLTYSLFGEEAEALTFIKSPAFWTKVRLWTLRIARR